MLLIEKDLNYIWHPCSQMKDHQDFPLLPVRRAYGCYIELEDGSCLIDAISSWWCKSLGHGHPKIKAALLRQADCYEHVIGANTAQSVLVDLSEKLCQLVPGLEKVFYASEGSSAIEVAIKMSLHARYNLGELQRNKIMALQNAYHGETLLALSVSDLGIYREAYQSLLLPIEFLKNIPYVCSRSDPLWHDVSSVWPIIEEQLNQYAHQLSAIIVEPILQGAAGMLIYSQDFLRRLRRWTSVNNVHLIVDEIMTGFGRTGYALASEHADIQADFICLGKALTAGWLPLSAVLTSNKIYDYFYADYAKRKSFLHSHTYSGNALAASVAMAAMQVYEEEHIFAQVRAKESHFMQLMQEIADETGRLNHVRSIGAVVAADLVGNPKESSRRLGYEVMQQARSFGVLLRPLGNTIYWAPPLNISEDVLKCLQQGTQKAIEQVFLK